MTSGAGYRPQTSKRSPRGRGAAWLAPTAGSLRWLTSTSQKASVRHANLLLFAVTLVELVFLVRQTAALGTEDWIYVSQHVLVLGISLTRRRPVAQDQSWRASLAVVVSYSYPYAEVIYLNSTDSHVAWPGGGLVLVVFSALLSLVALLTIGRRFGVRPALRGLATNGPYRLVRHPMYLAYLIADIGYLLEAWNIGTGASRSGGVGVLGLSHPCRGADAGAGPGMGRLCWQDAVPPRSGSMVSNYPIQASSPERSRTSGQAASVQPEQASAYLPARNSCDPSTKGSVTLAVAFAGTVSSSSNFPPGVQRQSVEMRPTTES